MPDALGCRMSAIEGGMLVAAGSLPALLRVETSVVCTGVAVDANAALLARHCLSSTDLTAKITRGVLGDECGMTPCEPVPIHVDIHPDLDVALITTTDMLIEAGTPIPVIEEDLAFTTFDVTGYGSRGRDASCSDHLSPAVTARFSKDYEDDRFFGAFRHADGPSICYGDSGAPATLQVGDDVHLLGIAERSTAGTDDSMCTPDGGFQLFTAARALAPWLHAILGR